MGIVWIITLLLVNVACAGTEISYPDCIAYNYETGEETVILAEEFMLADNGRMSNDSEMISPAYMQAELKR